MIHFRKCTGCNDMKDKATMFRIVRMDDNFEMDILGKKNGRGAYICKSTECIARAEKTRGLERSFKTKIDKTIYEQLRKELMKNG